MSEIHRLSTILFADIVGYTSLMRRDEANALDLLNHFKRILEKTVQSHDGDIVQYFGDACLLSFDSSTQGVQCAISLQRAFGEANIPIRIGMHLGEVVFKNNNVFGDGVNIASRIESMGVAGAILVSKAIRDQIQNKSEFILQLLGSFEFKNVNEPLEVFALANPGIVVPKKEDIKMSSKKGGGIKSIKYRWIMALMVIFIITWLVGWPRFQAKEKDLINEDEKSIAVMPFIDMSPDQDQEYFSDGMMEEILNHLVKIEGLQVTSRTSSMTYKGSAKKATEIAEELGVATILEGSVRKAGDILRITVQFIDGKTDKHLWSDTYDGNLSNVFEMQSDIALRVANELRAQITPDLRERFEQIPTENMEAYSLYLEARQSMNDSRSDSLLLEAIQLDPGFGEPYSILARNMLYRIIFGRNLIVENVDHYLKEVNDLLDKALSLNPDNADAYIHKGAINVWFDWDFERAQINYQKALQLNPSSDYIAYTEFLLGMGNFERALDISQQTISANQNNSSAWLQHAMVYFFLGEHEKADQAISIAKMNSDRILVDGNFFRLLIFQSKYEEMLSNFEKLSPDRLYPRNMGMAAIAYYHTGKQGKVDSLLAKLESQSKESPIGSPAFYAAMVYAQMGLIDTAFEWLDKAYQDREVEMYWLKVEPPFAPLRDDPRWTNMLNNVGFYTDVKG